MRTSFTYMAFGLSLLCALTAYAATDTSKDVAPGVAAASPAALLESVSLSRNELAKAIQPMGAMSGSWSGSWNGFAVTLETDGEPAMLTFTPEDVMVSKSVKRGVVTAEISRKGRIITIGAVSCLFQLDKREWNLRHHGCEAVAPGTSLELIKEKNGGWALRADNASILLSKG